MNEDVYRAAELVIGNLNEEGYLTASDDELLGLADEERARGLEFRAKHLLRKRLEPALGRHQRRPASQRHSSPRATDTALPWPKKRQVADVAGRHGRIHLSLPILSRSESAEPQLPRPTLVPPRTAPARVPFSRDALREAIDLVKQMDPIGVGARDLRECLLAQLHDLKRLERKNGNGNHVAELEALDDAIVLVDQHLHALQNKHYKEVAKAMGRPLEAVMAAMDFIRTLDPRPGLRYNKVETRLIEPDVAFVKQGDEYLVLMNDEEVPQLRLNPAYRRLLSRDAAEKDVRNYVKERYKSAIQLIKNIEQRKQTILRVCYSILNRQREFLDHGIDQLKPMMIKEVAEEIGVHPSTVSRAVANKYAHTPQGVFELRYFFSESVNGPEGSGTSLLILKRRVKKLIEEEDPARPLTDEQITRILQSQGIQVTRRTVAKYREDMRIPSTHQRRVKN